MAYGGVMRKVKDIITISYTKPNEAISTTKTFTSNNYNIQHYHLAETDQSAGELEYYNVSKIQNIAETRYQKTNKLSDSS